ncbi:MAG TPA: hypothetical protein VK943_09310 [Arenibaculum sp.]|nr:hypothetical protein [Arenibaculum sp.]
MSEGSVYRRTHFGQVVETARVLSVAADGAGIPHVRYTVHYEKCETSDELRTLALSSFAALFGERVGV